MILRSPLERFCVSKVVNPIRLISIFSIFLSIVLFSSPAFAQWSKMTSFVATDVTSIAIDKSDSNLMFVGTGCNGQTICSTSAGLYRTQNGGQNWVLTTNQNLRQKKINDIAISGTGFNKNVYAAVEGVGLYKSTDSGLSWQVASLSASIGSLPITDYITQLVVSRSPTGTEVLFAVVTGEINPGDAGIYITSNNASSWSKVYTGTDIRKLVVAENDPNTLYISTNDGQIKQGKIVNLTQPLNTNFLQMSNSLPVSTPVIYDFMLDPSNPSIMYASVFGAGNIKGLYRGVIPANGLNVSGTTWTNTVGAPLLSNLVADASQFPTKFYGVTKEGTTSLGKFHVYTATSNTAGVTGWAKDDISFLGFNEDASALVVSNNVAYAATKSGLYSSGSSTSVTGTNIRLAAIVSPATIQIASTPATYTLTLTNTGQTAAQNVQISSTQALPIGLTFVSSNPVQTCNMDTLRKINCNVLNVPVGTFPTTVSFQVRADSQPTLATFSTTFVANITDSNINDNTSLNTSLTVGAQQTTPTASPINSSANVLGTVVSVTLVGIKKGQLPADNIVSYTIETNPQFGTLTIPGSTSVTAPYLMNSPTFTYSATTAGTERLSYYVTDASGARSVSSFVTITNRATSQGPIGGSTSSSEGSNGALHPLLMGLISLLYFVRRRK